MNKISKIIWSLFSGAVCLVYKGDAEAHNIPDGNSSTLCTIYTGSYYCGEPENASNPLPPNYYDLAYNCNGNPIFKCTRTIAGGTFAVRQCNTCKTPYTLVKGDIAGDISCSLKTPLYKYTCQCVCSNCTASGSWSAYGTGYQKYTGQGCDCSGSTATCKTITDYRCASGYYGTATSGSTGCTVCPSNATCSGGNNSTFKCNKGYYKNGSGCTQCASPATTKAAGSYDISECYIPEGTYSDTTGKYAMNCDCPYAGRDNCGSGSSSSSA